MLAYSMINLILLFGIASATSGIVFGLEVASPHLQYVTEGICSVVSVSKIDSIRDRVHLECEWKKFIDAIRYEKIIEDINYSYEATIANNQDSGQKQHLYDLSFVLTDTILTKGSIYETPDNDILKKFRITSIKMRNLGIKRIQYDTFNAKCCQNTLESLDLNGNKLVRFDSSHLFPLKRLERLDLSNNSLQLGDANFEHNNNLRFINLSANQLQYLPDRLFEKLSELESIDLSFNQLKSVKACTFTGVRSNENSPAQVTLFNNPLECNCDVFYLSRHLNVILNLTCNKPNEYSGKRLEQLQREDPSLRCDYKSIEETCNISASLNRSNIQIVVLECIVVLFFSIILYLIYKNRVKQ